MHTKGPDFQNPLSTYSLKARLSQCKHSKIKDPKVYFQFWQHWEWHSSFPQFLHSLCLYFWGKTELQPLPDMHSLYPDPFLLPVLGALGGGRGGSQLCCLWAFLPVPLRQRERSVNLSDRHRQYVPLLSSLIHRDCICVFFSWCHNLECSYLPSWEWICTHTGHVSDSLPHFMLIFLFKWIYFLTLYYRWTLCP